MSSKKNLRDERGSQSRIARLTSFYTGAFIHMLFYRILIPVSIIYGITIFVWLGYPSLAILVKAMTAIVWFLFTPQFFYTIKGLILSYSRGLSFGHLNPEFVAIYRSRYKKNTAYLAPIPYIALAIWIIGFIAMLVWWSP
ncbi:MAG: hypothetical protein QXG05_03130 [Nitrososphaerota archaeon]